MTVHSLLRNIQRPQIWDEHQKPVNLEKLESKEREVLAKLVTSIVEDDMSPYLVANLLMEYIVNTVGVHLHVPSEREHLKEQETFTASKEHVNRRILSIQEEGAKGDSQALKEELTEAYSRYVSHFEEYGNDARNHVFRARLESTVIDLVVRWVLASTMEVQSRQQNGKGVTL